MPGTQGAEAELIDEPGLPDAVASQLLQDLLNHAQHAFASATAEHRDPSDAMDSRAGASVMGSPFGRESFIGRTLRWSKRNGRISRG